MGGWESGKVGEWRVGEWENGGMGERRGSFCNTFAYSLVGCNL